MHFFRERMLQIERPQPRFDMTNGNVGPGCRQSRSDHRGGITLHQHGIELLTHKHGRQCIETARGKLSGRLIGHHEVKHDVGSNAGFAQGLRQQFTMLSGRDDNRMQPRTFFQRTHHGCHFDRFRARSHDHGNTRRAVGDRSNCG